MTLTDPNTVEFKRSRLIYALFAFGMIACFVSYGIIFLSGFIALLFGIALAYRDRKREKNTIYLAHQNWQILTFWLGNLVAFPIAMIAHFIAIYIFTDFSVLVTEASSGNMGTDIAAMETRYIAFQTENLPTLVLTKWLTYGLALLWWLYRCNFGYRQLKKGLPPKVETV